MSLMSSLQIGSNALQANQIGLQVIGQNIANANTEGYIREELILSPAETQKIGKLTLGLGVNVDAVIQKIDNALEERLRNATSQQSAAKTKQNAYAQLEGVIGELDDTDLSTAMNDFFDSISEIMNQPESVSVRNLAMLAGTALTQRVNEMSQNALQMQKDVNDRIHTVGDEINSLLEEVRKLNVQIAESEGGSTFGSDAVGLRDRRMQALTKLSKLIEIKTSEQDSGTVSVYCGGDYLVIDGISRPVEVVSVSESGIERASIQIAETQKDLGSESGELAGLIAARDDIYGSFLDRLDEFAATLAYESNKVYSGGQGLTGYKQTTSEFAVDGVDLALNQAGLEFTPVNGSFNIGVYDGKTGTTTTTNIRVKLTGRPDDTTLNDVASQINAVDGLVATISETGKLTIACNSSDPDQFFSFGNDTSGILAALGINTFFSGFSAQNLGVSAVIQADPAKFAASQGGIGNDTDNAIELAAFLDRPLAAEGGASIGVLYDEMVAKVTQASASSLATLEGTSVFQQTLEAQKLAVSGVSLDEEAVDMLTYQRAFQATAKFIQTVAELLETLVNL